MDLTGLSSLFDFGGKLIDKIFPDPQKAQEAKIELFKLQQTGELAQLAAETDLAKGQLNINLEEAKSSNWWVSGWRPFVGWVSGSAFAYSAIVEPTARFIALVGFGYTGLFPVIDTTITMQVLFVLLGVGAMRSYDKKQGTAS